jgi:hypothetical protein
MILKWVLAVIFLYGGFVALIYLVQRYFQYFPERMRTLPSEVGLPEAKEVVLETADGERVIVWHVPPRGGQPIFLYFHGNGSSLRWRFERFSALIADGSGLIALSYRGYGGSSGRPSETGSRGNAGQRRTAPSGATAAAAGVRKPMAHLKRVSFAKARQRHVRGHL